MAHTNLNYIRSSAHDFAVSQPIDCARTFSPCAPIGSLAHIACPNATVSVSMPAFVRRPSMAIETDHCIFPSAAQFKLPCCAKAALLPSKRTKAFDVGRHGKVKFVNKLNK